MQLCSETNSALSSKLLRPEQTKLVDRAHTVHGVPSIGAFGLSHRTLAGIDADPRAFGRVVTLMNQLSNKEAGTRRGQFQVTVFCFSLVFFPIGKKWSPFKCTFGGVFICRHDLAFSQLTVRGKIH